MRLVSAALLRAYLGFGNAASKLLNVVHEMSGHQLSVGHELLVRDVLVNHRGISGNILDN